MWAERIYDTSLRDTDTGISMPGKFANLIT